MLKIWMCRRRGSFLTLTIFCGCARIVFTYAREACVCESPCTPRVGMDYLDTLPFTWPVSTLILDRRVASVLSGETDRGLCGLSCLNSETPNQSSFSLSLPVSHSVFLVAPSPSLHSDGGHVWSRAENGQSGSSHVHYYHRSSSLSLFLYVPRSHITLLILPLSLPFTALSTTTIWLFSIANAKKEGITLETQQYRDGK